MFVLFRLLSDFVDVQIFRKSFLTDIRPSDSSSLVTTPFSGQFRRQCMQFGKSAGNFGGSVFRRPFGHDSACGLSKLVALLPNSMLLVHNWSEKGVGAALV